MRFRKHLGCRIFWQHLVEVLLHSWPLYRKVACRLEVDICVRLVDIRGSSVVSGFRCMVPGAN